MATRRLGCSATRTCSAATPAARRNMRACRLPTSARYKVPEALTDEQVLFLTDIFPTGYMAAENCNIQPGDTVGGVGLRPGRPVCDSQRLPARRRTRHRHRHGAGAAPHGRSGWRRDARLDGPGCLRQAARDDRRHRPRLVHRRRRPRGARPAPRLLLRQGQDHDLHGDRPRQRAAPGDPRLPQGRHRLSARRLRRLPRQGAVRRRS